MMLRLLFPLLTLTSSCFAAGIHPLEKRDTPWEEVPSKLGWSRSGTWGDPEDKYFSESIFHPHYDGRFGGTVLVDKYQRSNLTALIQAYLTTMQSIGVETWLMHGSLLGWWWNRRVLAWDDDIDTMVSEPALAFMAHFYNLSMHHFELSETGEKRQFMLEVNPHWTNGSTTDHLNTIDARFIDTTTGLFVDITTLRKDRERDPDGSKGLMMVKDKHRFQAKDIYPLRQSVFEDRPVRIPYAYAELLTKKYGSVSLTRDGDINKMFKFNREKQDWVAIEH